MDMVTIKLTWPEEFISEVDRAAEKESMTRNEFITMAVKNQLYLYKVTAHNTENIS